MATSSFGLNHTALGSCTVRGGVVARRSCMVQNSVSDFARCNAFSSDRSMSEAISQQLSAGPASKYDRIVAFVEAHATPVAAVDVSSSCDCTYATGDFEQPAWHNSYDEEAEEGELCDEPHLVFAAAAVPAQVAAMSAAASPAAAFLSHNSWSYGDAENPKPWFYAWDEEAEGSFGLSDCLSLSAQLKAERRAALHEARHAARMARKMRRSQLHPQLGDLEHMQAWVGPAQEQKQQQKRHNAGVHAPQYLLNMLAADGASRQYRKPKQWHLTFDEDVHGPDAPETVLGSC